jgi:hypothetical protein
MLDAEVVVRQSEADRYAAASIDFPWIAQVDYGAHAEAREASYVVARELPEGVGPVQLAPAHLPPVRCRVTAKISEVTQVIECHMPLKRLSHERSNLGGNDQ